MKKKFRPYNFGIPIGIKIENLNKLFLYGIYEIEYSLYYKEKTYFLVIGELVYA